MNKYTINIVAQSTASAADLRKQLMAHLVQMDNLAIVSIAVAPATSNGVESKIHSVDTGRTRQW